MSEIKPQFTYSPESILSVSTGLGDEFGIAKESPEELQRMVARRLEHLEILDTQPGITVDEQDGDVSMTVDVNERFGSSFNTDGDPDIAEFLMRLNRILPFHPEDAIDRVVGLDSISNHGAVAAINHHFQRWLDGPGMTEEVGLHSVLAMALPFGSDMTKRNRKDFEYFELDGFTDVSAYISRITVRPEKFGITKFEETADENLEFCGEVEWKWVDLSTLGSCACWGATGDERSRVDIASDNRRLYEMSPHNVDFARQSLSLALGLGALTYAAAQYEGREDILRSAEWREPRAYPKAF